MDDTQSEDLKALQNFAKEILTGSIGIDRFELLEIAITCGLIKVETRKIPCCEYCSCMEYVDEDEDEAECHVFSDIMTRKMTQENKIDEVQFEELKTLQKFANKILGGFPGNLEDLDYFDLLVIAIECGLVRTETRKMPCRENCLCAAYASGYAIDGEDEIECYVLTDVMKRIKS